MKVVMLTGNAPNQKALAAKVAKQFKVAGIVIEERKKPQGKFFSRLFNALTDRLLFGNLRNAWNSMQAYYSQSFDLPDAEYIVVPSVNSDEVVQFLKKTSPDLIVVSGTGMIRKKILSIRPPLGIINLHTGVSPYIKGGPNCTNWCLATNNMHMIGNTVMYLDEGIDSGDIIATEFTPLSGTETLSELHLKVMEHAHDLYIRAIEGMALNGRLKAVSQSAIGAGRTYFNREWNFIMRLRAMINFRKFRHVIQKASSLRKDVVLVLQGGRMIKGDEAA